MASERPLPPQPSTSVHESPQTDEFGPATTPTALISQEGNPFSPSEGDPRRQGVRSNIPSDYFAFPTNSAGPSSPTDIQRYGGEDSRRPASEYLNNPPDTGLPIPPSNARFPESLMPNTPRRRGTRETRTSTIDYIVPIVEGKASTLKQRLAPTIAAAKKEREKYTYRAKWTGWTLNAAIGLQVLFGSLTTGLSATATNGRSAAIQTTVLGALSTIVASYLARARGSNEPELSITRVKDLDRFIRDCEAMELDHGYETSDKFDRQLAEKRDEFERILGSKTDGPSGKAGQQSEKSSPSRQPQGPAAV